MLFLIAANNLTYCSQDITILVLWVLGLCYPCLLQMVMQYYFIQDSTMLVPCVLRLSYPCLLQLILNLLWSRYHNLGTLGTGIVLSMFLTDGCTITKFNQDSTMLVPVYWDWAIHICHSWFLTFCCQDITILVPCVLGLCYPCLLQLDIACQVPSLCYPPKSSPIVSYNSKSSKFKFSCARQTGPWLTQQGKKRALTGTKIVLS